MAPHVLFVEFLPVGPTFRTVIGAANPAIESAVINTTSWPASRAAFPMVSNGSV